MGGRLKEAAGMNTILSERYSLIGCFDGGGGER